MAPFLNLIVRYVNKVEVYVYVNQTSVQLPKKKLDFGHQSFYDTKSRKPLYPLLVAAMGGGGGGRENPGACFLGKFFVFRCSELVGNASKTATH